MMVKLLALDTETTGKDHYHGALPFFVTVCDDEDRQTCWHWDVNPLTREVCVDPDDLATIRGAVDGADRVVGQNLKFDAQALANVGFGDWPWDKTEDTLIAGHVLASNQRHDLTSMATEYLGIDIEPYEHRLGEAVKSCRRQVHQQRLRQKRGSDCSNLSSWRIAEEGLPEMPSAKGGSGKKSTDRDKLWKFDMWLPQAMSDHQGLPYSHPWRSVLADYSNADSAVTVKLWQAMEHELHRRGLWAIYRERMKVVPIALEMEQLGVTVNIDRLHQLKAKYKEESSTAAEKCLSLAASKGYSLTLPKSGNNRSLIDFCFKVLKLRPVAYGEKSGEPSLDKETMEHWRLSLSPGVALDFVQALKTKRERDTSISYLEGYERFAIPTAEGVNDDADCQPTHAVAAAGRGTSAGAGRHLAGPRGNGRLPEGAGGGRRGAAATTAPLHRQGTERADVPRLARPAEGNGSSIDISTQVGCGWHVLHPNANITGSDTLRWSMSNPNPQNVGKAERDDGLSLRYCFGPAPGREWWSLDAKNIELRIPAYESGEQDLIDLFERENEPPFYGSNHLLNFSVVYPDIWEKELAEVGLEKVGPYCKKKYAATHYQWCKNGDFKLQYGGANADSTFRRGGATALLKGRFAKLEALNQKCLKMANKFGWVETIPDRSVDTKRGYPLLCMRVERGNVKPTLPLNYHVQSTAMWWTMTAMIRCNEQLKKWRQVGDFDGRIVLQVHDELVFDLPARGDPCNDLCPTRADGMKLFRTSNLWRIRTLQRLMAQGGENIGLPTPVGAEWHPEHWGAGVTL